MLSQSQANFFINRPISISHPLLREVFTNNSFEIFQFLESEDISNLKMVNKFFMNVSECHELFDDSIKSLGKLFNLSVNIPEENTSKKKSKFKEKYNFNKPIGEYYKSSDQFYARIQSGKKKK